MSEKEIYKKIFKDTGFAIVIWDNKAEDYLEVYYPENRKEFEQKIEYFNAKWEEDIKDNSVCIFSYSF